ncbi:MAG: hypothetical protein K2M56_08990 [Muribaculaceae bacterium]|nr:hypothetical protein [Muribaculaceae bacterium]
MNYNMPYKSKTELTEIRRLLRNWMEGLSSSDDEAYLYTLLEECGDTLRLPEDMRRDAELFLSMAALGKETFKDVLTEDFLAEEGDLFPGIPEEYANRINAALEEEIARTGAVDRIRRLRAVNIFRLGAACAIIIALTIGIFHIAYDNPKEEASKYSAAIAMDSKAEEDNHPTEENPPYEKMQIAEDSPRPENNSTTGQKTPVRNLVAKRVAAATTHHCSDYREDTASNRTTEEEMKLQADGYQIVTDEGEAEAIMATLIMRMQNNLEPEMVRLSEINSRYQIEETNL